MSLNTAHANNGVLIYAGEGLVNLQILILCVTFLIMITFWIRIMLFCDHVTMEFSGQDRPEFKGVKTGRLYLTTHRMIFNSQNLKDPLLSFSFPFCTMKDVSSVTPVIVNILKFCHTKTLVTQRLSLNSQCLELTLSRVRCVPRRMEALLVKPNSSCISNMEVQLNMARLCWKLLEEVLLH